MLSEQFFIYTKPNYLALRNTDSFTEINLKSLMHTYHIKNYASEFFFFKIQQQNSILIIAAFNSCSLLIGPNPKPVQVPAHLLVLSQRLEICGVRWFSFIPNNS